jgi:hypothetical protein
VRGGLNGTPGSPAGVTKALRDGKIRQINFIRKVLGEVILKGWRVAKIRLVFNYIFGAVRRRFVSILKLNQTFVSN